jgi:uncharacterized glyoxalase superfamily protein PhnB
MTLKSLTPMLTVPDMEEAVRFYRDTLGFAFLNRLDGWAALAKDSVEVMICLPNAHEPLSKPNFSGSLYFRCDNVDALWKAFKDKATVVYPIENFFYGMREFAIRDNNGYMLQFGQVIDDPSQIPPPD